ncbi:hypothetical protein B0T26DRAFT_7514 [Lasiosphaeria miniovina]|uniref:Uncharacterized protein n=1 Tax=Lasiosphaeria miniovina TaxID=1954250 RepID=A0AA40E9E6_9PEZI|nr:uncharacterized protein B0T26DRAFT_7514 [Lasiosphaeria miniovina]KAK0733219.1 hypothetical protein B0T26DRAFT_7514 [Lasiosphaeria miniovina]
MAETSTLTITRPPPSIIKQAPALRARDQAILDGVPKTKELRDWILKFRALKTPTSLSSRRTAPSIRPRLEEAKNDSGQLSEPNKPNPPTVSSTSTLNDTAVKNGIDLSKAHNSQDSGVYVNDDTRASSNSTGTTRASTRASSSSVVNSPYQRLLVHWTICSRLPKLSHPQTRVRPRARKLTAGYDPLEMWTAKFPFRFR